MTCEIFRAADGTTTFMCCKSKREPEPQCEVCGAMATNLCDGPKPPGAGAEQLDLEFAGPAPSATCDRLLCDFHSTQPPGTVGIDYCPDCARRVGLEPGATVRPYVPPQPGVEAEVIPITVDESDEENEGAQ